MRKHGFTFDTKIANDGELYADYITRITDDNVVQEAIFTRVESDKALKKQTMAINMFNWPKPIVEKVSKTARRPSITSCDSKRSKVNSPISSTS